MTSAGTPRERTPLSRDRILEAAIELIDEHGVEALTMRRLGNHLGVEAMSIYNHVPNKSALLDGIVERVVAEVEIPPPDGSWDERAKKLMRSYRNVTQRHPNVAFLLAMRPYGNIPALRQVEASLEVLNEAGLTGTPLADAFRSVAAWLLGFTLSEAAANLGAPYGAGEFASSPISTEEFPLVMEFAPYFMGNDADAQFEYGLDLVIAGLRALTAET